MSKGRKRQNQRPSRIHRLPDQNMRLVVGVLKRLLRRVSSGMQVPFLVVTLEPRNVPGMSEPVADPVITSLGLSDPRCAHLRKKLLEHLVEAGVLKAQEKPPEEEKKAPVEDGLEVDLGGG